MNQNYPGQVMIECPNTIFHLYVNNEFELTKIEIFMHNIRSMKRLGLNDIYTWCNRQGIMYDTEFNYHKEFSIWKTVRSYVTYHKQKYKYKIAFSGS